MLEGALQVLIQLYAVLPQISVHHLDHFVDRVRAVVRKLCDNLFWHCVGSDARGKTLVLLDEFCDVRSSADWGAHGAKLWHLLLLFRDGEGEGLNKLALIMCMIGQGVGRRSSAGGGTGMA